MIFSDLKDYLSTLDVSDSCFTCLDQRNNGINGRAIEKGRANSRHGMKDEEL